MPSDRAFAPNLGAAAAQQNATTASQRVTSSIKRGPSALGAWWRGLSARRQWTVATIMAVVLALMVEFLVFNYSALTFDQDQYPHRVIALPQHEQLGRPMAVLEPHNPVITLTELNLPIKTVYFKAGYGGRGLLKGQLYLKDDARAYVYSPVASFSLVPIAERDNSGLNPLTGTFENDGWGTPDEVSEVYLQTWPFGNTHELRLEFTNLRGEVGVLALELNKPLPLDISLIRLGLMTLLLLLVYTVAGTAVRQQVVSCSSLSYRYFNRGVLAVALATATLIFLAMSPWVAHSSAGFKFTSLGFMAYGTPNESLLMPLPQTEEQIINSDAYTQLLDALLKGQLHIDVTADSRLAYLDNPYDASERAVKNVPYLFDRAYHEGKFYVYFGLTPLVLIYMPIYLVTGMVPAMAVATYLGTILALLGLHLGSSKLTELLVDKVNPLLFCLLKLAFYHASLMFLIQVMFSFYALPYLTCCFCLGVLLWALPAILRLQSYFSSNHCLQPTREERAKRWALLKLSVPLVILGLAIVGIAGSRPLLVVFVLCLVPPVAWFLWRSAVPRAVKFTATAAVGIPVVLGAVLLAAYNYARFDSIFEFGPFKQFTSLDINFGHFQWSFEYIKAVWFHGFCENFQSSSQFPYVLPNETRDINYGNLSPSLDAPRSGVFAFPYFWLLPLIIVMVKRYSKAQRPRLSSALAARWSFQRLVVWSLVAIVGITPVFQLIEAFNAGTTMRYLCDITMMLTFVVLVAVQHLNWADPPGLVRLNDAAWFRALNYLGVGAICVWSLVDCIFLIFSSDTTGGAWFGMHPELWVLLSRILAPLSMAF